MSESGELDSGPSDKEGEKGKDSLGEVKIKGEGKAEEASNIDDTKVYEKEEDRTSAEEDVDLGSLSKKKRNQSNVPQPKYGDRSKRAREDVHHCTELDEPGSDSESLWDLDDGQPDGMLIFEMEAPSTNRLVIPYELASTYFPCFTTRTPMEVQVEQILKFIDSPNHEWEMPIKYYRDERGFMILKGWQKFPTKYKLKPMDLIRIYEPIPRGHMHHFLIQVENKHKRVDIPEFRVENLLFQVELDKIAMGYYRVFLAVTSFPEVEILRNGEEQKQKIMRFTDAECKDWYTDIIRYDKERYMVFGGGWKEFVEERGLQGGAIVQFYTHKRRCHGKHYLIGIVKKEDRVNPGQPSGGSGAGRDAGSGSGSYNWKEIAGGDYKGKEIAGGH